jgi:hypothetical protein
MLAASKNTNLASKKVGSFVLTFEFDYLSAYLPIHLSLYPSTLDVNQSRHQAKCCSKFASVSGLAHQIHVYGLAAPSTHYGSYSPDRTVSAVQCEDEGSAVQYMLNKDRLGSADESRYVNCIAHMNV